MDDINTKKSNTNRNRFVRIAEKRVNKILDDLDSLSKCSNKQNYQYDESDIKKIFNEIEKKLREAKLKFHETSNRNRFTLK